MKIIKNSILILSLFASASAFSAEAENNRRVILGQLYEFSTIIATFLGLIILIGGFVKLKQYGDNPNVPQNALKFCLFSILSGALIFNYSSSAGTMITTLLGDEAGFCININETQLESETIRENCWDSSQSELLTNEIAKIEKMNGKGAGGKAKENAEIIVMIVQWVGFIFFIVYLVALKDVGKNNNNKTYGSVIFSLIASALIVDLPHTFELIKETLETMFK